MIKTVPLLRLTLVLGLALSASACETMADLDPTGLLGGDSTPVAADPNGPPPSDVAVGTTPDLASLPSRPATSSIQQQQQQAQSLAADGAQVQYSADALRGGTEAAAQAPGAAPPPSAIALAAPPPPAPSNDLPPTTEPTPPVAAAPAPPPAPVAPPGAREGGARAAAVPAPARAAAADLPPTADAPMAAATPVGPSSAPSAAMPAAAIPPGAQPAVPANTPVRRSAATMARAIPSDAELGFRPSAAPPLDPSISDWVPAPVVARYRQANAGAGVSVASAGAAVPQKGVGGPDMSGAVVANLGALPGTATYGGANPTAVVYFAGDGTTLSAAARSQIRGAVQAFKSAGGAGSIRVVGHASSRTANMPVEKHLEVIFDKSQQRANAVAQELIHQGIPAAKVLVEAVGDSQPVYYESMPKGEDGNRRAEIFVQG